MSKLFLGGVPTAPDVEKLLKDFAVEAGTAIRYEQIESAIGVLHKAARFRTVTTSWRKRIFREKGLESKAEGGVFFFLTPSQAVDSGVNQMHRVGRALGRVHVKAVAIDHAALGDEKQAKHNLLIRESQALVDQARKSVKAIAGPGAIKANLRIAK